MPESVGPRFGHAYLLQRTKSAAPAFRYKSAAPASPPKTARGPTVVLKIDKNCPIHGSQDSIQQNIEYVEPQIYENYVNNNENDSEKVKPFTNNPPLPQTQRDIVGNNLYFNSKSQTNAGYNIENEQLAPLSLYREALRQNLTSSTRTSTNGFRKMHFGRSGGYWPHIRATNTHAAANLMFIDGTVRPESTSSYFQPRFAYPTLSRQNSFTSPSTQDLSNKLPTTPNTPGQNTKSLDLMTWSTSEQINHRPSLSQYSNRYERHAKDGFAYWPTDTDYKKPRCKPGTTGTYKRWLGISDSILKL